MRLRLTMLKSITFIVVVLAAITFAKEESNSKKKEEVGTVIGIDLGVSAFDSTERPFPTGRIVSRRPTRALVSSRMAVSKSLLTTKATASRHRTWLSLPRVNV